MGVCITPYYVENPKNNNEKFPVGCGKCPACLARRVSGWSFRLMQQGKTAETAYFLTLTYSTDTVPITPKGFMSLRKSDVQKFWKRLRKAENRTDIKYFYCGEYGGQKMRPHYHAIVFNVTPENVEKSWQLGNVHFGEVNGATIGYTLKYMQKEKKIPVHANDDRLPEYSNMSRGIGLNYLSDNIIKWHKKDLTRLYTVLPDGIKVYMPRYYREKIYTEKEKEIIMEHFKKVAEEAPVVSWDDENLIIQLHKKQFEKMYKQAENGRKNDLV